MTTSLHGRPVADALLKATQAQISLRRSRGHPPPKLASIHRAETSPFAVYLRQQSKVADQVGIDFQPVALPVGATAGDLERTVQALDADPHVHAILMEHPMPKELDPISAIARVRLAKDVDGISPGSLGLLVSHRPSHVPAVARAAVQIAQHYKLPIVGRRVAVVGRSESVGLPLALLLVAKGLGADATVTVAHSRTPDLKEALRGSEVIFSCAGHPGLLTRSNVPKDVALIDVGLSTVPDPSKPAGVRIAGDADSASLDGWASALTPVPGGVGPVTVACLMDSARVAWEHLTGGPE